MMSGAVTLSVLLAQQGEGVLGTTLDPATRQSIIDWYQYRRVCDNTRFPAYFQRLVNLHWEQYQEYLRVESTQFDPMAQHYAERWILGKGATTSAGESTTTSSGTGKTTDTRTGSNTNSGTDETKTVSEGSGSSTEGGSNSSKVTRTGGGSTTNSGTDTATLTHDTTQSTEHGAKVDRNTTRTDNLRQTTASHDKALDGQLPPSSQYTGGFPTALDWQFLSAQRESDVTGSQANTGTQSTEDSTINSGTDTVTVGGTDTTSTEHGLKVTTARNESDDTVDTFGHTNNTTSSGTDTQTTTHGLKQDTTSTGEGTSESSSTGSQKANNTTNTSNDTRVRESGRAEAPQDLLDRARNYILKTNALAWLLDKLEPCFMSMYCEED